MSISSYEHSQINLWCKINCVNLKDYFKEFKDDYIVVELSKYEVCNQIEVNQYLEHFSVNEPRYLSVEDELTGSSGYIVDEVGGGDNAKVSVNGNKEVSNANARVGVGDNAK
ncbi:hypothetical protein VNO78_08674 [Psophocarpus tetragonolobus]|uniref:Uncharacterized protein n=1 Tax=Psophocarpus tetragonolobus TaxID=3891 RepID=A0AAN9XTL6_PSOTE